MKADLNPASYDPKKWAAIEKLKYLQLIDGLKMKVEMLEVDSEGRILLDPDNPLHQDWIKSQE